MNPACEGRVASYNYKDLLKSFALFDPIYKVNLVKQISQQQTY